MGLFDKIGKALKKTTGKVTGALSNPKKIVTTITGSLSTAKKAATTVVTTSKQITPVLKKVVSTVKPVVKPVTATLVSIPKMMANPYSIAQKAAELNPSTTLLSDALNSPLLTNPLQALNPVGFLSGLMPSKETLLMVGAAGVAGIYGWNRLTRIGS